MATRFILLLSFFSVMACSPKAPKPIPVHFDWQGHRGCRGLMPENTIPAFLKALEFPAVRTLELDLAVSRDQQLVISHEPWFFAAITTQPGGDTLRPADELQHLLYHLSVEQIQQYDVGLRAHPRFPDQQKLPAFKPTLQQVIDTVRAANPARAASIQWNIEIKSNPKWDGIRTPPVDSFAQLVVRFLQQNQLVAQTAVQSFDVRALQAVHRLDPSIRLVLLVENIKSVDDNLADLGFVPAVYSPSHVLVDPELVRRCHQQGMQVIPWTVNETDAMQRLVGMGVDGIITDYPNRVPQ